MGMKELSGLVSVFYNWVVMVVQLDAFPKIVVHPTWVNLSGMQATSQLPFNTASAIYRGLYRTTRMPLLLFYSSKNINSVILGTFLLQNQIAHSPLEPMFLLLTMGFHSWHQIPPPPQTSLLALLLRSVWFLPAACSLHCFTLMAFSVVKEQEILAEISGFVDGFRVSLNRLEAQGQNRGLKPL